MNDSARDVLQILIGVIGLLILAIFIPLIRNALRKKPEAGSSSASQVEKQVETPEAKKITESLAAEVGLPPKPQVTATVAVEKTLKSALAPTKKNFLGRIQSLFVGDSTNSHLEEIEEVLYTSDLGPQTVQRLMESLEGQLSRSDKKNVDTVVKALKGEMLSIFSVSEGTLNNTGSLFSKIKTASQGPTVCIVVGVNGAGKTTSIGKISAQLAQSGKKVLVAAGDTFRAAAGNQLKVWTERAQVEIFSPDGVTDPSAVAFDAVAKAKAQGYDYVIIDTAGRLHTQTNLMEELKKVKRVVTKVIPEAPHEILIVLDANSGQNALLQAKEFNQALGLTGAILTKMDGTAKGGVAVGLACELKIPIKLIGVGEKIEDLKAFSSSEFVDSIFDLDT